MRIAERVQLLGLLTLGTLVSEVLAAAVGSLLDSGAVFLIVFAAGSALTSWLVVRTHRMNWPREVETDVPAWTRLKMVRTMYPRRARRKRIAKQVVVWVPSVIAALVLFFCPIASHLLRPGLRRAGMYRIPIPWTMTVFRWPDQPGGEGSNVAAFFSSRGRARFGVTPFAVPPFPPWQEPLSLISFTADRDLAAERWLRIGAGQGHGELTCSQPTRWPRYQWYSREAAFAVECATDPGFHGPALAVWFEGQDEDLPAFYRILERVRLGK